MVQNTLTRGGESGILLAADLPGLAVCKSSQGAPPGAPTEYLTGGPEVAMAEIAREFVTTRQTADRAGMARSHILYLIDNGSLAAQRVGYVWLVNVPSLEHYMANRPRPGLKPGQKISRPRKVGTA